MSNWWKSKTAPDRWKVVRITHIIEDYHYREILSTEIQVQNTYSGRIRTFDRLGKWVYSDFKGDVFVP